jgi:hypothetical protein
MRLDSRPLLDNPEDAALYVDEAALLQKSVRALDSGLNILVEGAWGSGKTSLLRQCQLQLSRRGTETAFVDLADALTEADVLELVWHALRRTESVPAQGLGELVSDPTVTLGRVAARNSGRYLELLAESRPVVVLLDNLSVQDVAYALFGRLRDRLWQLPLIWAVTGIEPVTAALHAPPADAFFAVRVVLEPLSSDGRRMLLARRLRDESPDLAKALGASQEGSPRRLLDAARRIVIDGGEPTRYLHNQVLKEMKAADLGRPASMLLGELTRLGRASASDRELLAALGWTRPRAVQVFNELERAGLVVAEDEPQQRGRPRRVYRPLTESWDIS